MILRYKFRSFAVFLCMLIAMFACSFDWLALKGVYSSSNSEIYVTKRVDLDQPVQQTDLTEANSSAKLSIVGCMATSCHGSNNPQALTWQRAGTIWLQKDPHATAYIRLLTEESLAIVNRLTNASWSSTDSSGFLYALEQKCVSCHANSLSSTSNRILGADCQVCHGPASAWKDQHYSSTWKSQGSRRFDNSEMLNTESIASRAAICASCHIGELNSEHGVREVNHELMAAGHPPMHFDFSTFMNRYPRHWDEPDGSTDNSVPQEFRTWKLGKLALTAERVKLLSDRATDVEQSLTRQRDSLNSDGDNRPWPELTEYSCYSCHHSLQDAKWRRSVGNKGQYEWDAWTTAELELAFPREKQVEFRACLQTLQNELESPLPQPKTVINAAVDFHVLLERELAVAINAPMEDPASMRQALLGLLDRFPKQPTWEAVVPWFIVTRALVSDLKLPVDKKLIANIEKQIGYQSYVGTEIRVDGPKDFDPWIFEEYRSTVLELMNSRQK